MGVIVQEVQASKETSSIASLVIVGGLKVGQSLLFYVSGSPVSPEYRDCVKHYVTSFANSAKDNFSSAVEFAGFYASYLREAIIDRCLPR